MNEQDFQQKLGDLITQINNLPENQRAPLSALAQETKDRHDRMKKTVADLQESLDYLRLSIKYLVFDLEATRRENEYLRKLVQSQGEHDGDEKTVSNHEPEPRNLAAGGVIGNGGATHRSFETDNSRRDASPHSLAPQSTPREAPTTASRGAFMNPRAQALGRVLSSAEKTSGSRRRSLIISL